MIQCTNSSCKQMNPDGSNFCEKCGTSLKSQNGSANNWGGLKYFLIILGIIAIIGCGYYFIINPWLNKPDQPDHEKIIPILKLAGSNTIGGKLAPALAQAFLEKKLNLSNVEISIPDSSKKVEKLIKGKSADGKETGIFIVAHGSGTAFDSLLHGWADIGMSSRRIKDDETAKLSSYGDMKSRQAEHILCMDGIAVIVNLSNDKVNKLSKEEVSKVFSGEISNWNQLGGDNSPIIVYARDEHSGTWDSFEALVLKPYNRKLSVEAEKSRFESNSELVQKVAENPSGIGFTAFSEIKNVKPLKIYEQGSVDYLPTLLTISTEVYALSRRLYLYMPPKSTNKTASDFIEFALSTEGQEIAKDKGFVAGVIPPDTTLVIPPDAPEEYRRLVTNATRYKVIFYFDSGSNVLDNKAMRDADRMVIDYSQKENTGKTIILIGFCDNVGNQDYNVILSRQRAEAVAEELRSRGLNPSVYGFGQELPIRDNNTKDGRAKNRRVEIWFR